MKKDIPIRFIDAGTVSGLQSQTIYHALAYAKAPEDADTIVFSRPGSPYVCVGFHQDAKQEVDIAFCRQNGIPVIRRETGGGTVYIDEEQIFLQWIFQPDNLPRNIDARFQLFVKPLIETWKYFGIDASIFPPNDVHVSGKKIAGTGAAAIGNAEVVTGNFLLGFDHGRMAQIIQSPDARFREMFRQSLEKYMTTAKEELNEVPTLESLKKVYFENCAAALGRTVEPGGFTAIELDWMERLGEKLHADEWLFEYSKPSQPLRKLKVHAGVWLFQANLQTAGGIIQVALRTKGQRIDKIAFSGDFDFQPKYRLEGFEESLRNVALQEENIREMVECFFELHGASTPNVSTADWTAAIMQCQS